MLRSCVVCSFVIGLAQLVGAQPSPTDLSIAAFLEKRVPEELATEGIVLSRDHLALKVEQLADKLLVSLVDVSTGRVAASTTLDVIPPDREAVVASVTHVAADLAGQAVHRAEPVPPAPPPDARADAERRDLDEMRFRKQALWFGLEHGTTEGPRESQRWRVFQGDGGDQLDPLEFYAKVGRNDLADQYRSRRKAVIGSMVAGGVSFVVAGALLVKMATTQGPDCSISLPTDQFSACLNADIAAHDQAVSDYGPPVVLFTGISLVAWGIGAWYAFHLQPITEREAKSLADQYNQGLRHNLGLPVVRRARLHDVQLTPFVTGHDAGLAFGARF
jgi:hypothetical protein